MPRGPEQESSDQMKFSIEPGYPLEGVLPHRRDFSQRKLSPADRAMHQSI